MRKIDELKGILKRFREQDDAIAALGSDPIVGAGTGAEEMNQCLDCGFEGAMADFPDHKCPKCGGENIENMVQTEVLAPKKTNIKSSDKPYDISTGYPYDFPNTDKPGSTPAKDFEPSPTQTDPAKGAGAPGEPEKGKEVSAAESLRLKRAKLARIREKMGRGRKIRETVDLAIVNDIIEEGGQKMLVLRFGGNMIAKVPFVDGYNVGETVEVEDMKKIISKATK